MENHPSIIGGEARAKADCSGSNPAAPFATDNVPVTQFGDLIKRIGRITARNEKKIKERPGYARFWTKEEWDRRFNGSGKTGNRKLARALGHRPVVVESVKLARAHTRRTSKSPSKMKFLPGVERRFQQDYLDKQKKRAPRV